MTERAVQRVVDAVRAVEGAGFPIRRPFPTEDLPMVDPFLMLDHIGPIEWAPGEAVGAPDHPHRGFETISYVLAGEKVHRDSRGHTGFLGPGDVQWMTAGSGIVHSEMPAPEFQRRGGLAHGFQIWVNLPARDKMCAPRYQDVPSARIPEARNADGTVRVRVVAGASHGVSAVIDTRTPITYLHFVLEAGAAAEQPLAAGHNALVYVFGGALGVGPDRTPVAEGQLAVLEDGDRVRFEALVEPSECLVLAGAPIGEPVARWGPFVMSTEAELRQALADYQAGRMGAIPG